MNTMTVKSQLEFPFHLLGNTKFLFTNYFAINYRTDDLRMKQNLELNKKHTSINLTEKNTEQFVA